MPARSSVVRSQTIYGPVVYIVGDRLTISRPTPAHYRRHE